MRWFFLIYAFERNIQPDAGGFRKLWELAWALKARGHDVLVFYPALPGFSALRDVPARAYPVAGLPYLRPVTAYLSMLAAAWTVGRRDRPNVVYFRSGINILPPLLGRALKARVILEVNADATEFHTQEGSPRWLRRLIMATERHNVSMSDLVVALTPGLKRMLIERYGVAEGKITVIPSGTDPGHFTPGSPGEAKTQIGLNPTQPVVGFVGIFYRHQGVHTLIEASAQILEESPEARFLLVGDGVMRPEWEDLAKRLHVVHALSFTGQVPYRKLPPFLRAMDVFVAPFAADRGETSPFKVLDALASGCPVIASDIPPIRLIGGDDGAIGLVPPDDPKALAEAILTLLRQPDRRRAMGKAGRAYASDHYGWDRIARQLVAALEGE